MFKIREITLVGVFVALLSVFSQVSIPTPILVPINLGLLGVFFIGSMLRRKLSIMVILIYLLVGAIGIPVFSNFGGGIGHLFGPTGGFLFGYLIAVIVIGYIEHKKPKDLTRNVSILLYFITFFVATMITYFVGSFWLAFVNNTDFLTTFKSIFLGFILVDLIKITIGSLIIFDLKRILNK
ncbi:MAG: biotin transporter BioY [Lachnospirales bacterium]